MFWAILDVVSVSSWERLAVLSALKCSADGECHGMLSVRGCLGWKLKLQFKGQYLGEQTLALVPSAGLGGDALAFGRPTVLSSIGDYETCPFFLFVEFLFAYFSSMLNSKIYFFVVNTDFSLCGF